MTSSNVPAKQLALQILYLVAYLALVQAQDINVPASNAQFTEVHGVGTYNYVCKNKVFEFSDGNGALQNIKDKSIAVGNFSYYTIPDGIGARFQIGNIVNSASFKVRATSSSTNANSLPNALLQATSWESGSGTLANTTYVQRMETLAGLAPAGPCTEKDYQKIVFRANYSFFKNSTTAANNTAPVNATAPVNSKAPVNNKAPVNTTNSANNTDTKNSQNSIYLNAGEKVLSFQPLYFVVLVIMLFNGY